MTTTTLDRTFDPAFAADDFENETWEERQQRLRDLDVPVFDPADMTPAAAAALLAAVPCGWDYVWSKLADRAMGYAGGSHRDNETETDSSDGGYRQGSRTARPDGPSPKQRAVIVKSIARKDATDSRIDLVQQLAAAVAEHGKTEDAGPVAEYLDSLTPGRDGTASKLIDALFALPWDNRPKAKDTGLDLTSLPSGRYAVPDGDTRLKLRINRPTSGKWAGFVFVDDGAAYGQRTRYGMQRPGETYRGKLEDQLAAIVADPHAAMAAYGQLVGECGNCSRRLEDETSVALGVGPICRGKLESDYGWTF